MFKILLSYNPILSNLNVNNFNHILYFYHILLTGGKIFYLARIFAYMTIYYLALSSNMILFSVNLAVFTVYYFPLILTS